MVEERSRWCGGKESRSASIGEWELGVGEAEAKVRSTGSPNAWICNGVGIGMGIGLPAQMSLALCAVVLILCSMLCNGESPVSNLVVTIAVNGSAKIAETGDDFICATLDWWPPEKCNYGSCSWARASLLDLDLENPVFANAVKAFSPLKIRLGGTLQDKVVYDVGYLPHPCHPFARNKSSMFGFTKGCLPMRRWDKLNQFFAKTGAVLVFGLNALYGRHEISKGSWGGAWDSSNARNFIQYTVDHGYKIRAWEFGNELSGTGIGARVSAKQYAADIIELNGILKQIYKDYQEKPLLIAPDGFFDETWFKELLQYTGPNVLDAVTQHIYNLGGGGDKDLLQNILNPFYLSREAKIFRNLQLTVEKYGPWSSAWVGEAGGAFNGGQHLISDAFVFSFWYLDQLGMASTFNTKTYCRQSLIGGNYGLLNTTTFAPNPDYYSALLWHRLMGTRVLSTSFTGAPYLRAYAHCAKNDTGITLLLINLSNGTQTDVFISSNSTSPIQEGTPVPKRSFIHELKNVLAWAGSKTSQMKKYRMEYHLTAKDGNLHGQTMLLNGIDLKLNVDGKIPSLDPVKVHAGGPISLAPLSIAFVSLPGVELPACKD